MKIFAVLLLVIHVFSCVLGVSLLSLELGEAHDLEWELFKKEHSKTYPSEVEEGFRKKIFLNNKLKILRHNHLYGKEHGFKLGINKYADLLHHEFISVMNGFKRPYNHTRLLGASFIEPYSMDIPKSIDWTKLGAVTPVKDQGQCGSCWAFSSTGALEGQHFRKTQKLVSLSEQNLVDCSGKYGNEGCNGGLMDQAFSYVKENGGIDTEESYPYEAEDDQCRYNAANAGATDKGYVDVPSGSEKALMKALASIGPISVAIDASQESFQFYQEGVYFEPNCSSEELDHGVLAVGYGTDKKTGKDYWLVKNSWGTSWGEKGYIKMARNHKNNCGVATQASYPLV